jgi:branched-chain amino acid transport system ATP-binding protein
MYWSGLRSWRYILPEEKCVLLEVVDMVTGYGKKQVLNGVSLEVATGEIVALVGHNGAGKSTLLKAVFGLLPVWKGQVALDGKLLQRPNPNELLSRGVVYLPQGNRVFTDLTVQENFEMRSVILNDEARLNAGIEYVLNLFPTLKARLNQRAGSLSGGEQQMLSLANALILSPRLLLLDEPSLGLAPPLVSKTLARIQQISSSSGVSVLIVEQKVYEVIKIAQSVYVLRNGLVSFTGPTDKLNDEKLRKVYL